MTDLASDTLASLLAADFDPEQLGREGRTIHDAMVARSEENRVGIAMLYAMMRINVASKRRLGFPEREIYHESIGFSHDLADHCCLPANHQALYPRDEFIGLSKAIFEMASAHTDDDFSAWEEDDWAPSSTPVPDDEPW